MQPNSNSSENPPATEPSQAGQVFSPGGQVTVSSDAPGVVGAAERPTAVTGPSVNTQAILPQVIPAGTVSKPPKRRLYKKPMVIALAAVLVLAGGSAAAYFGYYMPNQPENIWASALSNTGKGYDKLTQYTQTQFGGQNKGVKLS